VAFDLIAGHPGLRFAQPGKRPTLLHGEDWRVARPST